MPPVTATGQPRPGGDRYPLRNADRREGERLSLLEDLGDPFTVRWFEQLGVDAGWHCAELGAGGGSMVRWLSDRVGPTGSVTAVDRDASRIRSLAEELGNIEIVEDDLCELELPAGRFDLVHSRAVLMHLPCPDRVLEQAVISLCAGGQAFFEETDGAPAQNASGAPPAFTVVFGPITARWSWARTMADTLRALGLTEVADQVREDPLEGGTDKARFWKFTLDSILELWRTALSEGQQIEGLDTVDHEHFEQAVSEVQQLLDDPGFSVPFAARHRVTGRKAP